MDEDPDDTTRDLLRRFIEAGGTPDDLRDLGQRVSDAATFGQIVGGGTHKVSVSRDDLPTEAQTALLDLVKHLRDRRRG